MMLKNMAAVGLSKDRVCAICDEGFTKPKVLQCKHVFCARCLQKYLHDKKLLCPVCRYEHVFDKKSGIENLPDPMTISKLHEKITAFLSTNFEKGAISKPCGQCNGKATQFCSSCVEYICEACSKKHAKNKNTKSHQLTLVSKWTMCLEHTSRPISKYCTNCNRGLCDQCSKSDHSDHYSVHIKDEKLIADKRNKLQVYKKRSSDQLDFNEYRDQIAHSAKSVREQFDEADQRLEMLRREMNTTIDELKTGLREHLGAEEKKMVIHRAEIDDIRATRDSLLTFIDDVLQRNSVPDIVMTADELPELCENTAPVPPTYKQPEVSDYGNVLQLVKHLVVFKGETQIPTGKPSDASMSNNVNGVVHMGLRQSRGNDTTDKIILSQPVAYRSMWKARPDEFGGSYDVLWDDNESSWWVRTDDGDLHKYDIHGNKVARLGQGVLKGWGCICIDTKRGLLVTTDVGTRMVCMSKTGQMVKEITITGYEKMCGVTYCPNRDIYVVSDIDKHCLWFIGSDSEKVLQKLGSQGSGTKFPQFNYPRFVCHQAIDHNTCHIIVSDSGNHCIKVFSHTGEFIRKFGCKGSGDAQLKHPHGICMDSQNRIVVCDRNNKRVVCYWWDEGEKWEVLLTEQQLGGGEPWNVSMSCDGSHLVVVINMYWGDQVMGYEQSLLEQSSNI